MFICQSAMSVLYCGAHSQFNMRREATFNRSTKVLTSAFLSGTMIHGSLYAGAIGCLMNLDELRRLHKMMGAKKYVSSFQKLGQGDVSVLVGPKFKVQWCVHMLRFRSMQDVLSTQRYGGYTISELNAMDEAFNYYNKKTDPDCFLGMSAVFNALYRIHEVELGDVG